MTYYQDSDSFHEKKNPKNRMNKILQCGMTGLHGESVPPLVLVAEALVRAHARVEMVVNLALIDIVSGL